MATHKLNKTINTTWEIDENRAIWILGEKGRITGADIDGIHAGNTIGKATIVIDGEIALEGLSSAAYLESRRAVLTISDTGHLSALTGVFYHNDEGTTLLRNEGRVEGENGLYALTRQGGARIVNAGRVVADDGIEARSAGATIVNDGIIIAEDDGIYVGSQSGEDSPLEAKNATHIVNTGKITAGNRSVAASDVAVNLRNKGTLNGDVSLWTGEDVVNNRGGTINGDVWLGSNNDTFDGRGGRLNGMLYGGEGHDVVTLASPATLYVELAGEGYDTVRINATYRLGANVDNLTLMGKASHTGVGNNLGNTIFGNKSDNALYGLDGGDIIRGSNGRDRLDGGEGLDLLDGGKGSDILTGGADVDNFQFYPGHGRDMITDFAIGTDNIHIFNFGDRFGNDPADFADLVDIMSQPGDDTILRFSDKDVLILRDVSMGDLTWGDFAVFP